MTDEKKQGRPILDPWRAYKTGNETIACLSKLQAAGDRERDYISDLGK